MKQTKYLNGSHLLRGGEHPVKRSLPSWTSVSEADSEDLVYRGRIPSIIGKQIAVVKINHIESLIYCDRTRVGALRMKYQGNFKRVAGIALEDPKLPPLPRRPNFDIHGEEIDYIAMWADFGLEINLDEENEVLNKRRRNTSQSRTGEQLYSKSDYEKSDEELDEPDAPNSEIYERIMKGLNTLLPGEMELFRLFEKGNGDVTIAGIQSIKLGSVRAFKGNIYRKLRDYYGASSSNEFYRMIVRLYDSCKMHNLPVPSEHYFSTVKSRGKYAKKPLSAPVEQKMEAAPPKVEKQTVEDVIQVGFIEEPEPVWEDAPKVQTTEIPAVTFNQFIDAYGNRKDAVKALNQFNKLNVIDRQKAFEFIPLYKEGLRNISSQQSPYQYLASRTWH